MIFLEVVRKYSKELVVIFRFNLMKLNGKSASARIDVLKLDFAESPYEKPYDLILLYYFPQPKKELKRFTVTLAGKTSLMSYSNMKEAMH